MMAKLVSMTLKLETDLISDAVDEIARAHKALAQRHGAEFRLLDQRIERAVEAGEYGDISLHLLPDGFVIAEPPALIKELLAEIKRLGV